MFEGLKNLSGLAEMMKDLPRMKQKLDEVKERLGEIETSAETGGGAVRATVNGRLRVVSVEIDTILMSSLIDSDQEEDRALAQELIAGAVNAALEKAQERAADEFSAAAQEMGLPIPPGGLAGLL